eukprot:Gb_17719 [translate_table: standard]
MINAIVNFLEYEIYDLELNKVKISTKIKFLLITMTKKSIIVIKDINCFLELSYYKKKDKKNKAQKVGYATKKSGNDKDTRINLYRDLNFTNGLWACYDSEWHIIFTINHIDMLDPTLLHSGQMDK